MGGEALSGTAFVAFQGMFAIITVALIAGAIADRVRFGAWLLFAGLWATIVYFPVAHWVWAEGGWIFDLGVEDFAGGTAVHINAGAAALGLALVLGKRAGWPKEPMKPHNLPLVMLGAGLLWFGWFGFNAGSALAADNIAGTAFINTFTADLCRRCSAGCCWSASATASRRAWAPRPASSPAWSRSPRRAPSSTPGARWPSASSPVSSARWRSASSTASGSTTRWTSSPCT